MTDPLLGLDNVPGATITRYCSSSVQTTRMAMHAIRAGEGDVFISAGVECVSRFGIGGSDTPPVTAEDPKGLGPNPYLDVQFDNAHTRSVERAQHPVGVWHDPREDGELPDYYINMGLTAENVAGYCGITRADQDEFALRSQTLAAKALAYGFWAKEITPVTLADGTVMDADESPRAGQSSISHPTSVAVRSCQAPRSALPGTGSGCRPGAGHHRATAVVVGT